MKPGPELDALVHNALEGRIKQYGTIPAYSMDIAAAWVAVGHFFDTGEALHVQQDLDGKWIASLMHWTNGGKHGPRIWDLTTSNPAFKGLTAPHAISLCLAGYFQATGEEDCPFTAWEWDPLKDDLLFYDDSEDSG